MTKKDKVLLVSLHDEGLDSDRIMPPLGVMSLKSYLDNLGIHADITNDKVDPDNYSHIAISCMTPQRGAAYRLLKQIKHKWPDKIVIIGGPHATYYTDECVEKNFDYVVRGDGELALKEIFFGTPEKIIEIPISQKIMNTFPLPYREKSFINQYSFDTQGIKMSTILTAKGCPNKCNFCESAATQLKLYSPEYVGKQIQQIIDADFRGVMFFDDVFSLSLDRVKKLTKEISKYNIYYRCFGHARTMDTEMANILAETGCIETGIGVESGSQKILDIINKQTTTEQNKEYVELCNNVGIKVKAFLIVGLPGEDQKTLQETDEFLQFLMNRTFKNRFGKTISNEFDTCIFYPFRGTFIRENLNKFDICLEQPDIRGYFKGIKGASDVIISTSKLSSEDLKKAQKYFHETYWKRIVR